MQYQVKANYKAITVFATANADSEEQAIAQAEKAILRPFRRKYPKLTAIPETVEYTVTEIPGPELEQQEAEI